MQPNKETYSEWLDMCQDAVDGAEHELADRKEEYKEAKEALDNARLDLKTAKEELAYWKANPPTE